MEFKQFQQWLINHKGLQTKSARDVVSRIRRATKIVDTSLFISYDQAISLLERNPDFLELSEFVQPQVKRAIKLYYDYLEYKN